MQQKIKKKLQCVNFNVLVVGMDEIKYLTRCKKKYKQFPQWLEMAGVSRQTFWKWETGKTSPGYHIFKKLLTIVKEQEALQRGGE